MMLSRAWGLAFAWALSLAIAVYAVLRVASFMIFGEMNPQIVIASEHSGYIWRALIAGYAAMGMAIVLARVVRDKESAAIEHLPKAMISAAIAIALQAWLVP